MFPLLLLAALLLNGCVGGTPEISGTSPDTSAGFSSPAAQTPEPTAPSGSPIPSSDPAQAQTTPPAAAPVETTLVGGLWCETLHQGSPAPLLLTKTDGGYTLYSVAAQKTLS